MSAPTALHRAGCGAELGLEPIADTARLACPGCAVELSAFAGETGKLYDCGRCGGQFVEAGLLGDLLERRARVGRAVPRRPLARATESVPVRYVPCPACGKLMGRKNFGGTSGVIVDVCAPHGVWFDAGELPRVLDFVEKGGLAEERRREAEERKREHAARKVPFCLLTAVSLTSGVYLSDSTARRRAHGPPCSSSHRGATCLIRPARVRGRFELMPARHLWVSPDTMLALKHKSTHIALNGRIASAEIVRLFADPAADVRVDRVDLQLTPPYRNLPDPSSA